ncbi:MAG: aconitase X, partial [Bacillota bacterium]
QQIAWAESNAINYANSVLGARTNRYGDLVDICCAIVGRVPEYGLHLKENRAGQVLFKFEGMDSAVFSDPSTYAAIGYLIGGIAGERIPVLDGLPASTTHEDLKALSAAAASSGAVGLFHVVGVTPEAPTMAEAFQGRRPEEALTIDRATLESTRDSLTSARPGGPETVDLVIVGCPHSSYMEIERVLDRLGGRRIHSDVQFWIQTNRTVDMLLKRTGLRGLLDSLGIRLLHDGCILNFPLDAWGFKGIVTNSGKMAHYAPGHSGASVYFRSLDGCVESAVAGEVRCDE